MYADTDRQLKPLKWDRHQNLELNRNLTNLRFHFRSFDDIGILHLADLIVE